jgi:hypothetical protein
MIAEKLGFTLIQATMEFSSERAWQAYASARDACVAAGLREGSIIGAVPGTNWHRNRAMIANRIKARDVLREEIARLISVGELEVSGIERSTKQKKHRRIIPVHRLEGMELNFAENSLTVDGRIFEEIRVRDLQQAAKHAKPSLPEKRTLRPKRTVGRPPKNWAAYCQELARYKAHEGRKSLEKEAINHLLDWGVKNLPKKEQANHSSIERRLSDLYEMISLETHS